MDIYAAQSGSKVENDNKRQIKPINMSKLSALNLPNNRAQQNNDNQRQNPQTTNIKPQQHIEKSRNPYLNKITFKDNNKSVQNKFKQKFKQIISHRENNIHHTLSPKNILNHSHTFRINKGVKFPKAKRYLSEVHYKSNDPSPDQYKHQVYQKNKKSPKFSFGKQQKFFKNRKQLKCKTQIPGPGNYQSQTFINKNLNLTIPHADRFQTLNSKQNPGVGQYQIQKPYFRKTICIKFPQQRRKSVQNPSVAPGPNKYFIQQKDMKSTNQSFNKQKKLFFIDTGIPGVGQYSIHKFQQKHSPCARFPSTGLKDSRYKKQQPSEPGPGQYELCSVQKYKQKSKLTSVIFAKAKQVKDIKSDIPGPGNYHISQKRIKIKGGLLSSRSKYEHKQQVPGPSKYSPNINIIGSKSITARIGKQERVKETKQLSPSPHDYHPQKAKIHFNSTGFVFPKGKRQFF